MRDLKLLFAVFLLLSCSKVKKSPDYQRFVGTWENVNTSPETIRIVFAKNGKISIESSGERGIYYKTNSVYKRTSMSHETNGIYWDEYSFDKKMGDKKLVDGRLMVINPTNDSIYFQQKEIKNGIADSSFSVLMFKTK